MRYFGGKVRIGKDIAKFLEDIREDSQVYVEPFVGASGVMQHMTGKRMAFDAHPYLIAMYEELQKGWIPPKDVSKEEYELAKNRQLPDFLVGFIGFGCSFAGKWFGGYAKSSDSRNYCLNAHNSILKKMKTLQDVEFKVSNYSDLDFKDCLIYCDPPYQGTTQYGLVGNFDSDEFWNKMREWSKENSVVISEYNAPPDFECVWKKETKTDIRDGNNKKQDRTEKLFMLK